ncbi:MAG TPA: hypothetical protein VJ725_08340 [Thermoanaerobaculia bacterium]|nr:hypothetical protein [Thermoanaerobaculia bacterium]
MMKPLSPDTPLEVEQIWLEGIRARGPVWRLQRVIELTQICRHALKEAIRRANPDATEVERDEIFVRELYGEEVARNVIRLRIEKGFYDRTT